MTLNTIPEASQDANKQGIYKNQQNDGHHGSAQISTGSQSSSKTSSHPNADHPLWWLDFFTMKGRKAENQDSLLITTCLPYHFLDATLNRPDDSNHSKQTVMPPAPLLVLMADGVSACQFPKQASQLVINTVADKLTLAVSKLAQLQYESQDRFQDQAQTSNQSQFQTSVMSFDDDQIASIIKIAVNKANDTLCIPQAYQRVPPLLSTLSGLLCIGDRIHLFHTGDSRIYRVGIDSLTVLSEDHRIHRGQDKGALSAAIGADTQLDLQQSVFTLHQNECLALMTDGVYEHIDATELQFELCTAATSMFQALATAHSLPVGFNVSQTLCEQAFAEGSHDNLSMMLLSMDAMSSHASRSNQADAINSVDNSIDSLEDVTSDNDKYDSTNARTNANLNMSDMTRYQLPTDLEVGDSIDGFTVVTIIARTARSDVYLVQDEYENDFVLKSPSLDTIDDGHYLRDFLKERKIGLSLSKHRRAGEPAYNQADPNRLYTTGSNVSSAQSMGSGLSASGLLRYYPVPASTTYLYHLTEYIEGESLRDFIERNAPCDVWQTYDLLTKIGMAVRVMHRNYLLHQDIKPENVLLTQSGAVKLIDFGSASSSILKDSTRPPNGDLHYAAPEYYTDAPKGVHSDLFSIAVIGYELLTGQLPFGTQDLMNPQHALVMPAQPLRQQNVPSVSQQALMRALHSNTNARYQAIGEFLQDFNPDNRANSRDPEPLIKRNPLLVWHGICFIQAIIIVLLLWAYLA
jgi:protein phosphatase